MGWGRFFSPSSNSSTNSSTYSSTSRSNAPHALFITFAGSWNPFNLFGNSSTPNYQFFVSLGNYARRLLMNPFTYLCPHSTLKVPSLLSNLFQDVSSRSVKPCSCPSLYHKYYLRFKTIPFIEVNAFILARQSNRPLTLSLRYHLFFFFQGLVSAFFLALCISGSVYLSFFCLSYFIAALDHYLVMINILWLCYGIFSFLTLLLLLVFYTTEDNFLQSVVDWKLIYTTLESNSDKEQSKT